MEFVNPIKDKEKIELMKKAFKTDRDSFLFVLGINTALRVSDLLKLTVGDLKGSHLIVREQKTGKTRKQIISNSLRKEIDRYIKGKADSEFLFPSRKGTAPISRVQAHRVLSEAGQSIGLEDISTHSLRKTWSYHYYKATGDIATVQKLLNHSSQMVTMKYLGLDQDEMDRRLVNFGL
ncbi:tyrosine-type recombinase/integrase [Peribacillus sp. YIM B13477]|uniref:tyrosine-type recombinase/integrase n=1 Tax=Peribacillus sp. YIM B13477 TaxID=3366300 RepID=UPI00367146B9